MSSRHFFVLLFFTLAIGYESEAQDIYILKSKTASVQGTSSLHDWESDIAKVEWKGSLLVINNSLHDVKSAEVKIRVEDIKSTKGKMMDNKTYEAFNYEKNPYILFKLNNALVKDNGNQSTIEASGNLTMAGVTKPISLSGKATVLQNGDVKFSFKHKLKMTDFKMEPPTAVMGTIKVGDEVTVHFDLVLSTSK